MIIFFVILLLVMIMLLQQWTLDNGLDAVEGDFWPEENVIDPGDQFDLTVK